MIPGDQYDTDWEREDTGTTRTAEERWQVLLRTAEALDKSDHQEAARLGARLLPGRTARCMMAAFAAGAGLAAWHVLTTPVQRAAADAGADSYMLSLTNQDRASNGVGAVQLGTTLSSIGEGRPYGGCGFNVNGRSVDMIQRSYFSHQILNCGQYVFSMINANGIGYRSAGENIGWSSNAGDGGGSANYVNNAFMNSPDHRANILNGNYTHLGVGSANSNSWQGNSDVWMF
ncbi:MAG TPA: CAP domain-containing protein, partial [Candidatus Dormibacteraeota bacterium]|nr:CAP domain-containing protein [Candidatus Dormibacteraeota bacterium]